MAQSEQLSTKAKELLILYEADIPKQHRLALLKTVTSPTASQILSKWTLIEWKSVMADNQVIAQMFHALYSNANIQETNNEEKKPDMAQAPAAKSEHSSIPFAFCSRLPVAKGWDSNGHSKKPLHIKTDWTVGKAHCMYNLEFRGHLFIAKRPIVSQAVGYLYGERGHCCDSTWNANNTVDVSTYESQGDKKLVFKLSIRSDLDQDWHASDLIVHLVGGKNSYHQTAKATFKVLDVFHAD